MNQPAPAASPIPVWQWDWPFFGIARGAGFLAAAMLALAVEQARAAAPLPGLPLETSFDSVGWIPQGPAPTQNGVTNVPPDRLVSGCVTAVAPHPTDQNILYIGTANGGVWRTNTALAASPRWKALTDEQMSLSIGGLAVDPTDASGNTLVAGLGRQSGYALLGGAHTGLLRTTNGGATWIPLGAVALAGRSVYQLAARGGTILLSVPRTDSAAQLPGLYRTTDGGVNFANVSGLAGSGLPAGAVTHLAADPTNPARFYLHVASVGVFRSVNSGASWTNVSAGLAAANVPSLALAVGSAGALFAAEVTNTARVYRSANQGAAWTQMDAVTLHAGAVQHSMAADPVNANLVYLGGAGGAYNNFNGRVVRGDASLAAGSQWTPLSTTAAGGSSGTGPHTDSRALAVTAGRRLIEGNGGGVDQLAVAHIGSEGKVVGGVGSEWRSLIGNLQVGEMHSVAYDGVARGLIGGSQDNGTAIPLLPGGGVWRMLLGGTGGDVAVDNLAVPGQSLRYFSTQNLGSFSRQTFDSSNNSIALASPPLTLVGGGSALVPGAANLPATTPLATNAVSGGRLLISSNAALYESTDQANTVRQIDAAAANPGAKIAYGGRFSGAIVPEVIFYGSGSTIRYRTTSGGSFGSVAFPAGNVAGIALDPENWKNAYVIGTTAVFQANDVAANGAGSLTNITGNLTGVGTFHTLDYLTLPGGNALMVGTDLGAYLMRVAAPGVWQTLGNNLPHAPVYDSQFDAAGQVLVIGTLGRGAWLYDCKATKATGQYGETFQAFPEGTTSFPARTGELFSTHPVAQVTDENLRELQLTADGTASQRSAFRLPDLNLGRAVPAFSAKWNATICGASAELAEGFSLNFGPLGAVPATAFTSATYHHEDGFNAGLTVSVRTSAAATPGYYVRVNGTVVAGGFVAKPPASWGDFNATRHFFEADWRLDGGLTLRVDGAAIFTSLPTPGFVPAAGDRFVFGARTGSSDEQVRLDNIAVFTGGVLAAIQATGPYYFSAENAGSQGADKAFDGNVNTAWQAPDFTGHLGASLPAPKVVRLYTLASANDTPGRDPALWDFQTGNDGLLWQQHGAQSAQCFANRLEQRAFVVAQPALNGKFRLLIGENHEAPELQLAEFQAWELLTVPVLFNVANSNPTGAGSLRQAISDAATFAAPAVIAFAPALSGQTVTLTGGPLAVDKPEGLVIDASGLPAGLTISGNHAGRVFTVGAGGSCSLKKLTLTGGNATGPSPNAFGGAILNDGLLLLENCTLTGNAAAARGGAIFSNTSSDLATTGTTLIYCTVAGNTAPLGGGIHNNNGKTTLTHCTISGNTATAGTGSDVASYGDAVTETRVRDSIIGGSTTSAAAFVLATAQNSFASSGGNLIGSGNALGGFLQTGDLVNTAPLLAPLDTYGGPTKTMALAGGSRARNGSTGSLAATDQRGFPIVGLADIGAYEAGTPVNFNAYIWETLPAAATVAQHASGFDFDGDGASNQSEFFALTNAANPTSLFRLTQIMRSGATVEVTFPTVLGRHYGLEYTADFVTWLPVAASFAGTGNPLTASFGPVTGFARLFIRARVGP